MYLVRPEGFEPPLTPLRYYALEERSGMGVLINNFSEKRTLGLHDNHPCATVLLHDHVLCSIAQG